MYIRLKPFAVFWRIILALVGTVGLLIKFGVFRGTFQVEQIQYFSVIINIVMIAYFYVLSFWQIGNTNDDKTCILPCFKGMITLNLCLAGLIFHIILNKGVMPSWSTNIAENILSYITPLMAIIDWLFFDKKGSFKIYYPFIWCIPAYTYILYTYTTIFALRKKVGMEPNTLYPYSFLDIDKNGFGTTFALIIVLTMAFIFLGYLFFGIDQLPDRFSAIKSKFKKKNELATEAEASSGE